MIYQVFPLIDLYAATHTHTHMLASNLKQSLFIMRNQANGKKCVVYSPLKVHSRIATKRGKKRGKNENYRPL